MSERIAVIGGGIAGLGAAWLLSQRYRVTLIEAQDHIGGHTHTVDCPASDGSLPVDTGFIVYNELNYPHLTALFRHLDVPTKPSDMSFAFAALNLDLEYAGDHLGTLFAQPRNLVRPSFWRMVIDILRFNRLARQAVANGIERHISTGEILDRWRLGEAFRRFYLLPMSAAIWSCPPDEILAFPARSLLQFFANHGLVQVTGRPQWRTVAGGGREYVQRMLTGIHEARHSDPVRRIIRDADGVTVATNATSERFDQVVIATHADQALALLETPSAAENEILGAFDYATNEAWLHTDPRLMPRRRRVWASWNHLTHEPRNGSAPVSVTYWMNRLQSLASKDDIFVSLNPPEAPATEHIHRRLSYDHPVFDGAAVAAQQRLPEIQGRDRLWFCGSYFGYGFHEDALASAVNLARELGAVPPWQTAETLTEAAA